MCGAYWINTFRSVRDEQALAACIALGDGAVRDIRIVEGLPPA